MLPLLVVMGGGGGADSNITVLYDAGSEVPIQCYHELFSLECSTCYYIIPVL